MIMKKVALMICMLALVMACNMNDDVALKDNEVKVENGMIKSPEWLAKTIDDIADRYSRNPDTGVRIYSTTVFSFRYDNQEYILISDLLSSSMCTGQSIYTISGEPVSCESSLYEDLLRVENKKLIWSFLGK